MAAMKAVEIAERDDAAAKRRRNRRAPVQALHVSAVGKAVQADNRNAPEV